MDTIKQLRLGVLTSHNGTNLQAIMEACKEGRLNALICVVISNNSKSLALKRAQRELIPAYHLSNFSHPTAESLDTAILNTLHRHKVNLVLLAGYMKLIGPKVLCKFPNRVLNSHPSLLPKYGGKGMYGSQVHRSVIEADEKETGITIHLVDGEYDRGTPIAQCRVPVFANDTPQILEDRVKLRERQFWIETLGNIALAREEGTNEPMP